MGPWVREGRGMGVREGGLDKEGDGGWEKEAGGGYEGMWEGRSACNETKLYFPKLQ